MRHWRGGARLSSPVGRRSRCARSSRESRTTTRRYPRSVRTEDPRKAGDPGFWLGGRQQHSEVSRHSRFWRRTDAANTYTTGFVQNGQSRVVEALMKYICLGYLESGKNVLEVRFNFRNENLR